MLVKDKNSSESYLHVCRKGMKMPIEVRLHDIHAFLSVKDEKCKYTLVPIRYCPFCGVDVDTEDR